jgi:hypothetical protein
MKKIFHKTICHLLFSTSILLFTVYASLAYAEPKLETDFDAFIKKIEYKQKQQLSKQLPEGPILCNGNIFVTTKIIRQHLFCSEKNI